MNIIGLDISKISTAMVVECNGEEHYFSYNNHKPTYKWNEMMNFVNIRTYEYDNKISDYSLSEINKLQTFIKISNDLIQDLLSVIDLDKETILWAEGYSYGKNPGPLIDLVGIGSLIRCKIYENIPNIKIEIKAPKSLKTGTAEMVYGFSMVEKGKRKVVIEKVINTNGKGIKGGDFDKPDMLQSVIDYNKETKLNQFITNNYTEIFGVKDVPKPLEDIIDAFLLKELIKLNK